MTYTAQGLHLCHCQDCSTDFRSDDRWAVLCQKCDAADAKAHERSYASIGRTYHYSQFKRGGYRD